MAGVAITEGSGVTVAMDKVGTASAPTTDERLQYVKLDGGIAGSSAPIEAGNAAAIAAAVSTKALLTVPAGNWYVTHAPAANTQATASKAAGAAGVRHVCTGFTVTLAGGAAAPTAALVTVNLRDGATGAGTIISTLTLGLEAVAGKSVVHHVGPLNVFGTAATAMTVETSAAPGANASASVTLYGYSTPAA
jgi:hypothetical protein